MDTLGLERHRRAGKELDGLTAAAAAAHPFTCEMKYNQFLVDLITLSELAGNYNMRYERLDYLHNTFCKPVSYYHGVPLNFSKCI